MDLQAKLKGVTTIMIRRNAEIDRMHEYSILFCIDNDWFPIGMGELPLVSLHTCPVIPALD